jgi:hypothetical protein
VWALGSCETTIGRKEVKIPRALRCSSSACRCRRFALIIGRHVVGPVARQDLREPGVIGKVVPAVVEFHAIGVARERHIGSVTVEA